MSRTRFSSERIESLRADEIFVFGSNRQGWHGGGAAAYARQRFGAVWGEGVGRTGQCYAIPTTGGVVENIRPYVEQFIAYAEAHPELTFWVTAIGCGIARHTVAEMAPLFAEALDLPNVLLPQRFVEHLQQANE
ncbi:MAG TPA: hypothetical protein IAA13_00725 [Candidatus Alistipes merdigallinarum]|nr:hypothetical protein [Candidatus Alistipes merdigallinarum]